MCEGPGGGQHSFETERLRLRPLGRDDAALLFELDSDPEVMRWLSGGPGTPLGVIESEILPRCLAYPTRAPWAGVWVAYEEPGGEFAGWFSLRPSDDLSAGPELGYRLRRQRWGRGLATEGAATLLSRAFGWDDVQRIFGTTYEFNVGSRRVMEKLGMRHVRSYRLSAEELSQPSTFGGASAEEWDGDEVEYAISRDEWLGRASVARGLEYNPRHGFRTH